MHAPAHRRLLAPTIGTGVLMAVYLAVRPYGDAGSDVETARAFASTAWVLAHVCGALALASVGRLGLRLSDVSDSLAARTARWTGLGGAVLALPYYGAETFGLHAVGARALTDPAVLTLAEEIRNQPVALAMFAIGLVLLSVAGVAIGVAAARMLTSRPGWLVWPLAVAITLFPIQFYAPPAVRVAFGVAYALAAALFVIAVLRSPVTGRPTPAADAARTRLATRGASVRPGAISRGRR